jgi:hypothetical protein
MRLEPENRIEEIEDEGLQIDSESEEEFKIEEYNIPPEREDIFVKIKGVPVPPLLKEETQKQAKDIRDKYHESPKNIWIDKFMKNTNFQIRLRVLLNKQA